MQLSSNHLVPNRISSSSRQLPLVFLSLTLLLLTSNQAPALPLSKLSRTLVELPSSSSLYLTKTSLLLPRILTRTKTRTRPRTKARTVCPSSPSRCRTSNLDSSSLLLNNLLSNLVEFPSLLSIYQEKVMRLANLRLRPAQGTFLSSLSLCQDSRKTSLRLRLLTECLSSLLLFQASDERVNCFS